MHAAVSKAVSEATCDEKLFKKTNLQKMTDTKSNLMGESKVLQWFLIDWILVSW